MASPILVQPHTTDTRAHYTRYHPVTDETTATDRSTAAQTPLSSVQVSSVSGSPMSYPLHAPGRSSNFVMAHGSSAASPASFSRGPERKYILFGILDQDPHKLACIDLPCRRSHHGRICRVYGEERDSDFFRDLRETYRGLMGIKRFFLPFTLDEFRFVKVSMLSETIISSYI